MRALLVLKPDFHQTFVLGVARITGTLAGAALATFIAAALRPGEVTAAILIASFAWLCYCLNRVNYALFSVSMTVYIVFLLTLAGLPEMDTVKYRAINTTAGGLAALLAYGFWPVSSARR